MKPSPNTDETHARIVAVAYDLFRHYGYAKTTVADIARTCRMSNSNVYRSFPSKAAINEAICRLVMAGLEDDLRRIAATDATATERLVRLVERVAAFTTETFAKDRKIYDLVTAAVDEDWAAIRLHVQIVRTVFCDVIEAGIYAEEFEARDADWAAQCFCFGVVGYWHPVVAAQSKDLTNIPRPAEMAEFLLSALKRASSLRGRPPSRRLRD